MLECGHFKIPRQNYVNVMGYNILFILYMLYRMYTFLANIFFTFHFMISETLITLVSQRTQWRIKKVVCQLFPNNPAWFIEIMLYNLLQKDEQLYYFTLHFICIIRHQNKLIPRAVHKWCLRFHHQRSFRTGSVVSGAFPVSSICLFIVLIKRDFADRRKTNIDLNIFTGY